MKRMILILFVSILQNISAQIPNADFESWSSGNPASWQTTNIPIVPASIVMNSDVHSGLMSVKGTVVNDNHNRPFQPYLANCGPSAQGFPVSEASTLLTGWYKLFLNTDDRFTVNVKMYNEFQEVIAEGFMYINASINSWTQFNLSIEYNTPQTPNSCSIFFTITDSTMSNSGQIGSYFLLDELNLSGLVGINEMNNDESVLTYPNPVQNILHVKIPIGTNNLSHTLFDATGKKILEKNNCTMDETLNLEDVFPGLYFLQTMMDGRKIVKRILVQ